MKTLNEIFKNRDEEINFHKQVLDQKNYNTVFSEIKSIVSQQNDKEILSTSSTNTSLLNQPQNDRNKTT